MVAHTSNPRHQDCQEFKASLGSSVGPDANKAISPSLPLNVSFFAALQLKKSWQSPTPSWSCPARTCQPWHRTTGVMAEPRSQKPLLPSTMAPSCCCLKMVLGASTSVWPLRMATHTL